MEEATWLALTAILTALGGAWTWYAWRNRGAASGVRGAAITVLFPALFLTDTLELVADVGTSIADWATGLVFSPVVWIGIVLFGVSVLLFGASNFMRNRGAGGAPPPRENAGPRETTAPGTAGALPPSKQKGKPAIVDDDLADIEAILRKRGIN